MTASRIRTIQLERPSAGKSADEVRGYDAIERSLQRAIPQWARGSVLLGGSTGVEFTAGTVIYVAHKLGRRHAGWLLAQPKAQGVELSELLSTDPDYSKTRRDTHLQLRPFRRLDHTENVNFPSIGAGASSEMTFTVSGARPGDAVLASPTSALAAGLALAHGYSTQCTHRPPAQGDSRLAP
jgi:hypothetical protein